MSERAGYDAATWKLVRPFNERVAEPDDVERAHAVFALGDTVNGKLIDTPLPQAVIWYPEEEVGYAAVLVQAEAHESEDGDLMEVAGLVLPDGRTAVALFEDLEGVEGDDAEWLELLAEGDGPYSDAELGLDDDFDDDPDDDDDFDDDDDDEDEDDDRGRTS